MTIIPRILNTVWLKFGVAKLLCICIDLTKFEENPEGWSFFCVDWTWNDPIAHYKENTARERMRSRGHIDWELSSL